MPERFRPRLVGRVMTEYQAAYPDPLLLTQGETVKVGQNDAEWPGFVWCTNLTGHGGWVPQDFIERQGDVGTMRCDYSAAELTVSPGEQLVLHRLESGWYWATNNAGQSGWVPADHIEVIE